ncbi:MAG: fibronectin type III domain-containing protein [Flavobacteriales bacterium]|nr:fibronectin type III domain-containing protein [Flavobacteriales bacterium]MCC6938110.1 fibronectin type III domain-containing protein [Flavobacteriales bacterium]
MKANIKLSLFRLSVLALLALLRNVVAKLTGNTSFPTPPVSLADMKQQGDDLEAAIEAATNGSKGARIARDNEVVKTRVVLRSVADYVRMVAGGDKALLESTGFELANTPEPIGKPNAPLIQEVRMTGEAGEVEVLWTKERGADSYNVFRTLTDPAGSNVVWEHVGTTTKRRFTMEGMESLKRYWFAVRAVGAAGSSVMSDPAIGVAA